MFTASPTDAVRAEIDPVKKCPVGTQEHNGYCWNASTPPKNTAMQFVRPEPLGILPCGTSTATLSQNHTSFEKVLFVGDACSQGRGRCMRTDGPDPQWSGTYCVFEQEPQCPIGFQLYGTTMKTCINTNPLISGAGVLRALNISTNSSGTTTDTRTSGTTSSFATTSNQSLTESKTFEIDGVPVSEAEYLEHKEKQKQFNKNLLIGISVVCALLVLAFLIRLWIKRIRGK
jgi:hypothetical protein